MASAALLAAFAYLFLPLDDIGDVFADANFAYVVPSLGLYFLAVYARTLRWRYILFPLIGRPRRALYPVVVVGYMANNLLPVRLGELVRSYYASMREPVSPATAFGTIVVERASDVVALLFFIAVVWIALPTSGLLDRLADPVPGGAPMLITLSLVPLIAVIAVMVAVTVASDATVLGVAARILRPLPRRLQQRLLGLAGRLIEGLTVLRSPRALAAVIVLSLPVWLLEAGMILVIALGFNLTDTFTSTGELIAALLLFTAIANLAGVVPSASGGLGPFEFFGAATLAALGVPEAGLFVLTVHVALLVPVTVLGGVMLLLDGTSLRLLLRQARADEPFRRVETASEGAPEPTR